MEEKMIEVVAPVSYDGYHFTTRLKNNYPRITFGALLIWLVVAFLIYDYSATISINMFAMYAAFMVVAVMNETEDDANSKKETTR